MMMIGCGKYVPSKSVPFASVVAGTTTATSTTTTTTTTTSAISSTSSRRSTRASQRKEEATEMECPLGPVTEIKTKKSELLYNEFIVYKEEQSVMRYLVKVRFDFGEKKRGSKRK